MLTAAALLLSPASVASASDSVLSDDEAAIAEALGGENLSQEDAADLIDEWETAKASLESSVAVGSAQRDVERITLSTGTVLEVGAEPVALSAQPSSGKTEQQKSIAAAGLSGQYRIWGNNGFFYMEYYVTFGRVSGNSSLTTVVGTPSTGSMTVSAFAGATWDGKSIRIDRRTETNPGVSGACCAALVRGVSKLTYPGNILQREGGVVGSVKNGQLSTYLW